MRERFADICHLMSLKLELGNRTWAQQRSLDRTDLTRAATAAAISAADTEAGTVTASTDSPADPAAGAGSPTKAGAGVSSGAERNPDGGDLRRMSAVSTASGASGAPPSRKSTVSTASGGSGGASGSARSGSTAGAQAAPVLSKQDWRRVLEAMVLEQGQLRAYAKVRPEI